MDSRSLDAMLSTLSHNKSRWFELALCDRIKLFQSLLQATYQTAQEQVKLSCQHKHIPVNSPAVTEEWLAGPIVQCRMLRLLIKTLSQGQTSQKASKRAGNDKVQVFPGSLYDRLILPGFKAEIWKQPKIHSSVHEQRHAQEGLVFVLGAGNVSSIAPLDAVTFLARGEVVLLKLNPVNDYLAPVLEKQFADFIKQGFFQVITGDKQVGHFLSHHPLVDRLHMTGSDKTHAIICFGEGKAGETAKRQNQPILNKPITSELGNITPVILCPGRWRASDLEYHAWNVASQLANNAGFNCVAPRMLIMDENWPLKSQFLSQLKAAFNKIECRVPFYPGAEQCLQQVRAAHQVVLCGKTKSNTQAWMLVEGLSPEEDSRLFKDEFFCGAMAQVSIKAQSVDDFLKKAVDFCNQSLWGTLCAEIIIDPKTQKQHQKAFEQSLQSLQYGGIAINHWPGVMYGLGELPWGGFPGQPLNDIQSGLGFVHNALMIQQPQKSVLYGPFRSKIMAPLWFAQDSLKLKLLKRLLTLEYRPSLYALFRLLCAL